MRKSPATGAARRGLAFLSLAVRQPPPWLRCSAGTLSLLLVGNVLWHGAQPYAVGLVPGGWDKLAHAGLHFVLCASLLLALKLQRGWWAVALCAAFAALDEWSQQFNPGRSVSVADWAVSVVGAVLALAAAHALAWRDEIAALRRARLRRVFLSRGVLPPR
jgi:VanZ family protein